MGTRISLRVDDIGMAALEARRWRSRSRSVLRRFRFFIENGDWDRRFLEFAEHVEQASLPVAVAALLYIVSVGVRIAG